MTNLNPEALAAGLYAGDYAYSTGGDQDAVARAAILAYAQASAPPAPVLIETVAQLKLCAPGTAFLDSDGDVCVVGYRGRIMCQDGDVYAADDLRDSLPAVVLQVPEVALP